MSLGPIPPYTNPPIQPFNYQPRRFIISAVSLGQNTLVTATKNMDYVIGQLVRLLIPNGYGCTQLDGTYGYVIEIPSVNQVLVAIDSSSDVNQFMDISGRQQPQIIPVGDVNSGVISNNGVNVPSTAVPGAFINIS